MFNTSPIATVYLTASPADADRWLVEGVPPAPTSARPPLAAGRVAAWLAPEPASPGSDAVWLVAAVETVRVLVADWDMARGAETAPRVEDGRRLTEAYRHSATPLADYRLGQFRRPQAWVEGGVAASALARLPSAAALPVHGAAYARQVYQALRAMVGAPADAPLAALVAAVVARGRGRLVAAYPDPDPVYLYAVDEGAWYFSLATEFNGLTASS